ncbi:uncharacterized protein LOC111620330 [Centruroides sculpturatus]|uniref:uncharacterized protein LOC111620330 n=1 Tax=Centruroides sculpturatus TaxID=218467 RepID=UPI000C6EED50|nr:uncharacterized protein LOC111620330 [Centruroides sculpturatus]
MDISQQKRNRKVIKQSITRHYNFAFGSEAQNATIHILCTRITLLDDTCKEYLNISNSIIMYGTDEQSTAQEKAYEEVEEKYIQPRARTDSASEIKRLLDTTVRALAVLKLPTNHWDHILVYMLSNKLNNETTKQLELKATTSTFRTFNELKQFLEQRYRALEISREAEQLLHSIEVSDGNYTEAWKILQDRYENERQIINSHLKALFQQPRARTDSASEIKRLLDTTVKHVRALAVLKLPTDHWDHILVYTLSNKLDDETRKQWELKATTTTFPTFNELKQFLEQRYRALEISVSNMWKQRTQQNIGKLSNTLKAHSVTVLSCPVCKEAHHVFYCPAFQKQNVKTRKVTIKNAGLCFNCFKGNHSVKDCKSTSTCKHCRKKHNTMLHEDESPAQVSASNAASSCITANCNTSEVIITHHASETQQKTVLLATAVIFRVCFPTIVEEETQEKRKILSAKI